MTCGRAAWEESVSPTDWVEGVLEIWGRTAEPI